MACVKLSETEETMKSLKNEVNEKTVIVKSESPDYPSMFIWKIDNFSKLKREAKAGVNQGKTSAPFYTEHYGYKLVITLYPNGLGLGKGNSISVFVSLVKGEYDAILHWPFRRKAKLTLLDQQENPKERENYSRELVPHGDLNISVRPGKERIPAYRGIIFMSQEKLETRCYVVDDTLFLQLEVGPPSQCSTPSNELNSFMPSATWYC